MKSTLTPILLLSALILRLAADSLAQTNTPPAASQTNQTVCGYVATTRFLAAGKGAPTFLNLGKPYPNHDFTVVIWGSDRPKFSQPPEVFYKDTNICVSGIVTNFQGKPEMIVHEPSQITVK